MYRPEFRDHGYGSYFSDLTVGCAAMAYMYAAPAHDRSTAASASMGYNGHRLASTPMLGWMFAVYYVAAAFSGDLRAGLQTAPVGRTRHDRPPPVQPVALRLHTSKHIRCVREMAMAAGMAVMVERIT